MLLNLSKKQEQKNTFISTYLCSHPVIFRIILWKSKRKQKCFFFAFFTFPFIKFYLNKKMSRVDVDVKCLKILNEIAFNKRELL